MRQPNIGMTMLPKGEAEKSTPSAAWPTQRRNNDDRESRSSSSMASPGGLMIDGAHGTYSSPLIEVLPPQGYSDGRLALRPNLSIKLAGATDVLSQQATQNRPRLYSAATEVRCGIELSPCSTACPSGTIYTSFWPDICVGLLGGTSAAPLSVGLPFDFRFADQMTQLPYLCWASRRHLCRLSSRLTSDLQIKRRSRRDDFVYKQQVEVQAEPTDFPDLFLHDARAAFTTGDQKTMVG
ncbi:hypothetical protein THAOC_34428 [Thalassiosira oceanica]|uniref:Uncharacterized protein n=1 Tax=Thalassiosira oceanica TaxID=159749 RepID=K0RCS4_THAOC|nr:hypothetical protein THAOC_34428 [Thalassiosira oceanica]|eukprot:EJK46881.1 hypothetical protein THAOC_34428 [Thalassiosira oceanica]